MARPKDPAREEQRRSDIMLATFRLLARMPHHSMTLGIVAKELGTSRGMITYYFPSKEELILATVEHFLSMREQMLLATVEQDKPVEERLRDLVAMALPSRELLMEQARFTIEALSFSKSTPAGEAAIGRVYHSFVTTCRKVLSVGLEQGFIKNPDHEALLPLITGLIDGLALQIVYRPDVDLEELREQAFTAISKIVR